MIELICAFFNSFLLTFIVIPAIIKASKSRGLLEEAREHRIHTVPIPTFGGLGIFIGAFFSIVLWTPYHFAQDYQYILSALMIILLIGAKDDLVPMTPYKKLIGEIIACLLLILFADIRLTSMYGVFGIGELSYVNSIFLSLFTMIVIINAFNLIDGINGLSGSIATLVTGFFGVWFALVGRFELAIMAFSLMGSMIAFLRYNLTPAKIYMGDTGSLLTGAVLSILSISFIEQHNLLVSSRWAFASAPAVAFGLLILPLFDTLRVFIIRVLRGASPFSPAAVLLVFNLQYLGTLALITVLLFGGFLFTLGIRYFSIFRKRLLAKSPA